MVRYTVILFTVFLFIMSSCVSVRQASYDVYMGQIQMIERAYSEKEIGKADYLRLKMGAQNAYFGREAARKTRHVTVLPLY